MDDKIHEIREAISEYQDAYSSDYQDIRDDLEFASLKQWEVDDADRLNLVMDHIGKHKNLIVNPIRLHPFGFGITADEMLTPEDVSRINAHLGRIQQDGNFYSQAAQAMEHSVLGGRGFMIVGDDWKTYNGLQKKITFTCPLDPTSVFIDTASESIDGSDAENAGLIAYMGEAQAKRLFGIEDSKVWDVVPSGLVIPSDCVPTVSYWSRASESRDVVYIQTAKGIIGIYGEELLAMGPIPVEAVVGTRKERATYVNYTQIVGNEIISEAKIDSPFIPVVPFYGESSYVVEAGGLKVKRKGLVYRLRDTQKLVNLGVRAEAERLDMAPKSPWIATPKQVLGNAQIAEMWERSNEENRGVLIYEPDPNAPAPQRANTSAGTAEIQATRKGMQADMSEQLGYGAVNFGAGKNEASGFAISLMQETADYQSASYVQNWEASVIQVGRIVCNMYPSIYPEKMPVSFETKSGKQAGYVGPSDISGKLNVTVVTSASYQQKRRQGSQILSTLAGQSPDFMSAMAYDIVRDSGVSISDDAMEMLKRMRPAHLTGEGPDPEAIKVMEQQAATIQELQRTMEQYEALIGQFQAKELGDDRKAKITLAGKVIDSQTQILLEQMKQDGKMDELQAKNIADIVAKIYDNSLKEVELETQQGGVKVNYTNPMSAFTPMASGPLVVGNQGRPTAG
jgi:hypothetical protein